jgi:hypothetical protein
MTDSARYLKGIFTLGHTFYPSDRTSLKNGRGSDSYESDQGKKGGVSTALAFK